MQRLLLLALGTSCANTVDVAEHSAGLTQLGNLAQRGAFTCDLTLDAQQTPLDTVAGLLEIDRMQMSGSSFAEGMKHKIVPMTYPPIPASDTFVLYSGGRYLFDTRGQARTYGDFVTTGYVFDSTLFVERPYFLASDCHDWEVVAASEYVDDYQHRSLRTERWLVPDGALDTLRARWANVDAEASRRGYAAAWLLYNRSEQLATLVTFDDGLDLLVDRAVQAPLGELVADTAWTTTLDRDQYTMTNWQPFVTGDRGTASAWPNYPLLPFAPSCGDAVCEPSRGESSTTCAGDCAPGCGDATCSGSETAQSCPADCQMY